MSSNFKAREALSTSAYGYVSQISVGQNITESDIFSPSKRGTLFCWCTPFRGDIMMSLLTPINKSVSFGLNTT